MNHYFSIGLFFEIEIEIEVEVEVEVEIVFFQLQLQKEDWIEIGNLFVKDLLGCFAQRPPNFLEKRNCFTI